jgi:protein crumbs
VYDAQFSYDEDVTSVTATFRTKSDGTLLHIQGEDDNELKIMIVDGQVETILPVYSSMKNFTFGSDIDDGEWHKVQINSFDGIVRGYIDGENVNDYYLDGNETDLDMFALMTDATIVLGSAYDEGYADYFRGCAGEVRIGSVLLPYFTETELVNNTVRNKFVISESVNITKAECVLCYEHECENSGVCRNPAEKFECDCQPGIFIYLSIFFPAQFLSCL